MKPLLSLLDFLNWKWYILETISYYIIINDKICLLSRWNILQLIEYIIKTLRLSVMSSKELVNEAPTLIKLVQIVYYVKILGLKVNSIKTKRF